MDAARVLAMATSSLRSWLLPSGAALEASGAELDEVPGLNQERVLQVAREAAAELQKLLEAARAACREPDGAVLLVAGLREVAEHEAAKSPSLRTLAHLVGALERLVSLASPPRAGAAAPALLETIAFYLLTGALPPLERGEAAAAASRGAAELCEEAAQRFKRLLLSCRLAALAPGGPELLADGLGEALRGAMPPAPELGARIDAALREIARHRTPPSLPPPHEAGADSLNEPSGRGARRALPRGRGGPRGGPRGPAQGYEERRSALSTVVGFLAKGLDPVTLRSSPLGDGLAKLLSILMVSDDPFFASLAAECAARLAENETLGDLLAEGGVAGPLLALLGHPVPEAPAPPPVPRTPPPARAPTEPQVRDAAAGGVRVLALGSERFEAELRGRCAWRPLVHAAEGRWHAPPASSRPAPPGPRPAGPGPSRPSQAPAARPPTPSPAAVRPPPPRSPHHGVAAC
eukprot:tig00000802_g4288.t1